MAVDSHRKAGGGKKSPTTKRTGLFATEHDLEMAIYNDLCSRMGMDVVKRQYHVRQVGRMDIVVLEQPPCIIECKDVMPDIRSVFEAIGQLAVYGAALNTTRLVLAVNGPIPMCRAVDMALRKCGISPLEFDVRNVATRVDRIYPRHILASGYQPNMFSSVDAMH